MILEHATIPTPLGAAHALLEARTVRVFAFEGGFGPLADHAVRSLDAKGVRAADAPWLRRVIDAYFASEVDGIEEIDARPCGTVFQARVWAALRRIPAGETRSYGELAASLGTPLAARAVGAANRQNPVWLVVPCHRVIGANGKLTGYACGLDRKQWLLSHEASARGMLLGTSHEWRNWHTHRV